MTVVQDGSVQLQTIGAAIRALRTGQVVKVLDRGPYKKQLQFDGLPLDTGLISEQQTILETEAWDDVHHAHGFGPLNGFPPSGMRFIATKMDRNAYVRELGSFAKSPSDLLTSPVYLSSDPNHSNAWRIAMDSALATGGAGGAWPTYTGSFPPGPAPQDGDWFIRVREKWATESIEK